MRKSSVCGPHAVGGWKIRTLWPPIFGVNSKISQDRKALWPKREIALERSPKAPKIDKNRTNRSQAIFRKRSQAWATDVWKIFGALKIRKVYWPKLKSLLELQKSYASRTGCIRSHLRKTSYRFGGRRKMTLFGDRKSPNPLPLEEK